MTLDTKSMEPSPTDRSVRVTASCLDLVLRCRRLLLLPGLLGAMLLLGSACDTSVQPIVPSDQYHYSVFGVLNPAQDTQWVRVESLEEPTSGGTTEPLDVTVRLENQASGQSWTLRDSLMEVFRDEFQHNFWTTAPIASSTSYRLTVSNPDGDTTWAETTTPDAPPTIRLESPIRLPCRTPEESNQFEVRLDDVEELAALQVRYYQSVYAAETFDFDHYDGVNRRDGGYEAFINYYFDLQRAQRTRERPCLLDSAKVIAGAGGPDWPEWARYREATISDLARPDSFTNVEGGHGLLSGVYLDTMAVEIVRDTQ